MAICQYFLRGQCRFGDTCRNEHPANAQQSGFGNTSWTREGGTGGGGASADTKPSLPFTVASITNDLTPNADKPIWPLTSYAPSKHEPLLLSGLDESPEELRVKYVAAMKAGSLNEYLQYQASKIAAAEQVYANARTNSAQAYEQAVKQSKLPAASGATAVATSSAFRQGPSGSVFPSTSSAFGSTSTPATSAFGSTTTPSAFGSSNTTTSAFGKPAFGQPAFGQPAFGQSSFGHTSTLGGTASAFGRPQNAAAPVSAFSQPQPQATSVFGQPSQLAATSAFGQPSAFGQASQMTAPSVIKPASGAFGAFAGTGASAFGNVANTASNTGGGFSAFAGQPSAFGLGGASNTQQQTGSSVFGQPSFGQPVAPAPANTASAFNTPTQGTNSVFGTPSAFGPLAQQPQQQAAAPSVFPNPTSAFITNPPAPTSAFGQLPQGQQATSAFGVSAFGAQLPPNNTQPISAFTPAAPSISMEMKSSVSSGPLDFTNMKASYKPGSTPYDQQLPPNYMELLPKPAQEAFQCPTFVWGKVPEWVPPLSVR